MPVKRSYSDHGDACAAAHAMELLGDRWTYPILRETTFSPKRFAELQASVRGITPAVLTTRLRELEASGLVEKCALPGRGRAYASTAWARELRPVFEQLARWAHRSPRWRPEGRGLTPDGVANSMLTMAPAIALDPPVVLQLDLRDDRTGEVGYYSYRLAWGDALTLTSGEAPDAHARVSADSTTWTGVLYQGVPLSEITIDGDAAAVGRVVAAFATG